MFSWILIRKIMLRSRVMLVLLTLKASADSSDSCVATSRDITLLLYLVVSSALER